MKLLALATAAVLLQGCSSVKSPVLTVTDAKVTSRTKEAVLIEFTVEAQNFNAEGLPLSDTRYDVFLDGRQVFHAVRCPQATVQRFGNRSFIFPASITLAEAQGLSATPRYRITGDLLYLIPGESTATLFQQNIIPPSVSFSGEGTIDLGIVPAETGPQ